ncbi:hypothetical protein [Streptomyces sp. NPDC020742]|uniref:tryptophan biosynthesis modulator TrpM n=1 Tax=unclassified Streptomyces TaxID=2593676 RepID=UPI00340396F0
MTASAFRLSRPGPAAVRAAAGDGRHVALALGFPPAAPRRPEGTRSALPPWHRGCRAPARRVHGRRVRYHIGSEPGQINGRRWRTAAAR